MKQKITFLLLAVFTTVLSAQTVNIQGDPYGGNPYATITDAVFAANDGDVILITGVHTETISFGKSITLRGTDPTTDIIQAAATASNDGTGSSVINISRAEVTDVLTVTIENLGIRHGNADSNTNGGGINADKVTGQLTLRNLIIENNHTAKNGGGVNFAGSNVDVIECTIKNNTSTLDGGGIIAAPNNGAGINCIVNIEQSLVDSNTGRNGGGIYINGNNGFGNDFTIDINVENSTVSNNNTTSAGGGTGGGAIWCKVAQLVGASAGDGNINLKLVHATLYNNLHASAVKNGLRFTGTSGVTTNFSAYNSIVVTTDDVSQKAVNFTNSNTTDVANCILGGLEGAGPFLGIIDDTSKNNEKGKTATFAGLAGTLTNEGGSTQVLAITETSNADDFCTATTGISLPIIDQRGFTREGTPDAGAYEFGGVLSTDEVVFESLVKIYPNPAKNIVHIEGIDNIKAIRLYSILGGLNKVIYYKTEADVSDLAEGIYLLSIETSDNKKINRRLVIN
jgi:hypothetical protein